MRFKSSKVQPELVASRDASRPVLSVVHLNAEQAVVEVTDSYMLARFPVELHEDDTSGRVPVEALKAARKPPSKYGDPADIFVNGNARVSQDGIDYLTVPRDETSYQFPNTQQLIPDDLCDFEIGINAGKLLKLAKAMGSEEVRIRFVAEKPVAGVDNPSVDRARPAALRPMVVQSLGAYGDDDPVGILMPIRIVK